MHRVKIEDKPMYSVGFERLAENGASDEDDIVELLATMASFAEGWIAPKKIEVTLTPPGFFVADVADVEAIPSALERANATTSPGLSIVWDGVRAKLPEEVESIESEWRAIWFEGSTDHGRGEITIGIYWSAWLKFPKMLNDAIDRVLDRDTGWARAEWSLTQVNHWLDRDDED